MTATPPSVTPLGALIGDLRELFAEWRARDGSLSAATRLALEILRSLPALGNAAIRHSPRGRVAVAGTTAAALAFGAGAGPAAPLRLSNGAPPPVVRQLLSGPADDWEPSLAVGGDGWVTAAAARFPGAAASTAGFRDSHLVAWSGQADAARLGPDQPIATAGTPHHSAAGDQRIRADGAGRLYASWIQVEWDSAAAPGLPGGGLVLARSDDHGRSWRTAMVATIASGVADKPELAVSADGRRIYLAFMARGTLDVMASSDGGTNWSRHVADSTLTGHWPSGIALGADGVLWITDVRQASGRGDSTLATTVELLRSADQGATWTRRTVSRSTRRMAIGDCPHHPICPVQMGSGAVAVDQRNRVHVIYAEGRIGERYDLWAVRSDGGGEHWSPPGLLTAAPRPASADQADHYYPMIAAGPAGSIAAAWFDDRAGPLGLWARRSTDGGRTWNEEIQVSRPTGMPGIYGEYGDIAIDRTGALHLTWGEGVGHVGAPGARGGVWYARVPPP